MQQHLLMVRERFTCERVRYVRVDAATPEGAVKAYAVSLDRFNACMLPDLAAWTLPAPVQTIDDKIAPAPQLHCVVTFLGITDKGASLERRPCLSLHQHACIEVPIDDRDTQETLADRIVGLLPQMPEPALLRRAAVGCGAAYHALCALPVAEEEGGDLVATFLVELTPQA